MKRLAILLGGLVLAGGNCGAEEADEIDPFGPQQPPPKLEIPKRGVLKLPSSVVYQALDDGRHQYRISGLYALEKDDKPSGVTSDGAFYIEYVMFGRAKAEATLNDEVLTIISSHKVPNDALAHAVDGMSGGGILPTWSELEARDFRKSEHYDLELYEIEKWEGEFPAGLAWLPMSKWKEIRVPFSTCFGETGTLLIGPTTTQCMCQSRFAIRLLDENDRLIWQVADPTFGKVQFALGDLDGDRHHEVYLESRDHGTTTLLVLKPKKKRVFDDE